MARVNQDWVPLNRAAKLAGVSRLKLLNLALAGRVRASAGPDGRVAVNADDARALNAASRPDACERKSA